MCSLVSYAAFVNPETANYIPPGADFDEFEIPAAFINSNDYSQYETQLFEKAATIFGTEHTIVIKNVYLTPFWFRCNIVIENYDEMVDVTQTVVGQGNEYPQGSGDLGTTSTIDVVSTSFDIIARSNVRLLASDERKLITVIYHFTEDVPSSPGYHGDNYYVILNFPYNDPDTPPAPPYTGIDSIEIGEPTAVEYYDLMGRKLDRPQPGIVIEKQGNKTTKKLYR